MPRYFLSFLLMTVWIVSSGHAAGPGEKFQPPLIFNSSKQPEDLGTFPEESMLRDLSEVQAAHRTETQRIEALREIVSLRQGWQPVIEHVIQLRPFLSVELQGEIDQIMVNWSELSELRSTSSPTEIEKWRLYLRTLGTRLPSPRTRVAFHLAQQMIADVTRELLERQHGDLSAFQTQAIEKFMTRAIAQAERTVVEKRADTYYARFKALNQRLKNKSASLLTVDELADSIATFSALVEEGLQSGFAQELHDRKQKRVGSVVISAGIGFGAIFGANWGSGSGLEVSAALASVMGVFFGAMGLVTTAIFSDWHHGQVDLSIRLTHEKWMSGVTRRCSELLAVTLTPQPKP